MNNGSLPIKGNNSRPTTTSIPDQSLRTSLIRNTDQDTSLDLTDVSILSVGLTRYQHHDHGMLTDDDDDNEVVRIEIILSKNSPIIKLIFRSKPVTKKKTTTMMMMMMIMNHFLIHVIHY